MTNKKYIIRNCPCLEQSDLDKDIYNPCLGLTDYIGMCKDCTDCVLKQIVERCKKVREGTANICTNPYEYATYCETRGVLELLDIQEVE